VAKSVIVIILINNTNPNPHCFKDGINGDDDYSYYNHGIMTAEKNKNTTAIPTTA
jgi:hypothetical protein